MKKTSLILLALISLINFSCQEETVNLYDNELEVFKNESGLQFNGTVLENEISWKFDNYNNGITGGYASYWGAMSGLPSDTTIQQKGFIIGDYEKREDVFTLEVKSPAFSINSSDFEKKEIFEVGKKQFNSKTGSIYQGFKIAVVTNNGFFTTNNGDQANSSFEIVKVVEQDANPELLEPKKLLLWMVFSCNLYDLEGQKVGEIKNGKFITEFRF
jgi:hypothetical protein